MRQKNWLWSVILGGTAMTFGCAEEAAPGPTESIAPAAVTAPACLTHSPPPSRTLAPNTKFTIRTPDSDAVKQITGEFRSGDLLDTLRLGLMEAIPQAFWFTSGTPAQVQAAVHKTMTEAALTGTVPTLVAYDIPNRDCGGLSAGGALDTASYEAWIDAFAAGIGNHQAVVILEPDSLGLIPNTLNIDGSQDTSCQFLVPDPTNPTGPQIPDPTITDAPRYAQLGYAIDSIESHAPAASVYLDGTHSAWLNVGEASGRLYRAGVQRAQGFYLDISNYQFSPNLTQFGTWISECLAIYGSSVSPGAEGAFGGCPNEYWNGGPLPSLDAQLFGEWNGVALDATGVWSDTSTTQALNTSAINLRYSQMLAGASPTVHFVIDSSRNGKGPLNTAPFGLAPYDQPASVLGALTNGNWCNPPGAGLGLRPTTNTGVALLDSYLWVKTPGESDGTCDSTDGSKPRQWDYTQYNPWNVTTAAQATWDPLWGMVDPAAGLWFAQQALQLAQDATPPLL
jgi:endoglucanase